MKVIMSANQAARNNSFNTNATKALVRAFQNNRITHTAVIGVYKGKQETSFMLDLGGSFEQFALIKKLAFEVYHQECILVMLNDGSNAALMFPDGSRVELGSYKETTPYHAKQQDAYTLHNGRYYVCQ